MTFAIPEQFAQRPPDVGSLLPEAPQQSVAAWLPAPGEQGFVCADARFTDERLPEVKELLHGDLMEFGYFWTGAEPLRPLFTYLGYAYVKDEHGERAAFPHPTLRNERARALDVPREHRLPRFAVFPGQAFDPPRQIGALAGGNLLAATQGEVAVHDALNHAIVQNLLAPGHMRRLQRQAQRVHGNAEEEVRMADRIEAELNVDMLGNAVAHAVANEGRLPFADRLALTLNPDWRKAAASVNVAVESREAIVFEDAAYMRDHCLFVIAAARQALAAM